MGPNTLETEKQTDSLMFLTQVLSGNQEARLKINLRGSS